MTQGFTQGSLQPGTIVLGKYRVDHPLGEGGMGFVVAATHVELMDRVAIKVLRPEYSHSSELVARFIREARAAASLRSEHVVRVFDVGRLDTGLPYMVMELLEGRDLGSGPRGEDLPIEEAVDYVIQTCDAMAAAHGRGMVHRDLKPANLFLALDEHGAPTVKVLDFGISKLKQAGANEVTLTAVRGVMGSPLYMSPEQVRSARDVDQRADIWSLGTILYELISGRSPFDGESVGAVFLAIAGEEPVSLSQLRSDVPAGLDAIVARCLRKDPAGRFQTARELQASLLPFGSERSRARVMARHSVRPGSAASSAPPLRTGARTPAGGTGTAWVDGAIASRSARKAGGTRVAVAVAVVGALGGAAAVGLWGLRGSSTARDAAPSSLGLPVSASGAPRSPEVLPVAIPAAPVASLAPPGAPGSSSGATGPNGSPSAPPPNPGRAGRPTLGSPATPAPAVGHSPGNPPAGPVQTPVVSQAPAPPARPSAAAAPRNPLDIEFK